MHKERDSLEVKVQERTKDLEAEKRKADDLLLNILPNAVAEELKLRGEATPGQFDAVTVMFTDFKGFTQIAEKITPAAELSASADRSALRRYPGPAKNLSDQSRAR